jgi:protease IV
MSQYPNPNHPHPSQPPPPPHPSQHPGGYGAPQFGGHGGWQPPPPPPPSVVHVVSKPGGFWRAVMFVVALLLFAFTFAMGIIFGVAGMMAGANYDDNVVRHNYRDGGSQSVAILPVLGEIDDRQADFVRAAARNILEDSSIQCVVLRVDSPGGSVSASDQIWYEVKRMRDAGLPVVASFGGVAASGGYYISCGADHIIAEETCITGSIGVIAQVLTLEGLMDKIGVKPVTLVASGSPEKNIANDIFRAWDERDKAKILTMLDAAYATFTKRVSDGRKNVISTPVALAELANGSIFTAEQAKTGGLIDGIGYLDDAITKAESLGGIASGSANVFIVRKRPTFFGDGLLAQAPQSTHSLDAEHVRSMVNDLATPRIMYRLH